MTWIKAGSFCLFLMFFCGWLADGLYAEEEAGGRKKFGVIHNIAEDRQIERVGGIYEPEGLDKYMKRHFDGIARRLEAIDDRLAGVESELEEIRQVAERGSADQGPAGGRVLE